MLDDDPTGTQTVHDVPVLTVWDEDTLRAELAPDRPVLLHLDQLAQPFAGSRRRAASDREKSAGAAGTRRPRSSARTSSSAAVATRRCAFTSRHAATRALRGHYPLETDVLARSLDRSLHDSDSPVRGRRSVHRWGMFTTSPKATILVPAAETPFARDAVFGYRSSNLRDYVEEKTRWTGQGRRGLRPSALDDLRRGGSAAVTTKLLLADGIRCASSTPPHARDLEVFVRAAWLKPRRREGDTSFAPPRSLSPRAWDWRRVRVASRNGDFPAADRRCGVAVGRSHRGRFLRPEEHGAVGRLLANPGWCGWNCRERTC